MVHFLLFLRQFFIVQGVLCVITDFLKFSRQFRFVLLHYPFCLLCHSGNFPAFSWNLTSVQICKSENSMHMQKELPEEEVVNFQIKLCDVEDVDLLDRRGYLVISITLSSRGEGKIYLRKTEGIRDWFNSLKVSLFGLFYTNFWGSFRTVSGLYFIHSAVFDYFKSVFSLFVVY